jgi:hypothetical protein
LEIAEARKLAEQWWTASEVEKVFPNQPAVTKFFEWHGGARLGRKRLLDTLLAATYWQEGVSSLLTTNPSDFAVLKAFSCITPLSSVTSADESAQSPSD